MPNALHSFLTASQTSLRKKRDDTVPMFFAMNSFKMSMTKPGISAAFATAMSSGDTGTPFFIFCKLNGMEDVLTQAYHEQRIAYEALLAAKDKEIARLREQYAKDTSVSDGTLFLYRTWLDEFITNPVIAQAVSDAALVVNECPPHAHVNRVMCFMFAQERASILALRAELAAAKVLLDERDTMLKRLAPIDKIISENNFYQTSLMEMGKRVIDLEGQVNRLDFSLMTKTEQVGRVVREEYDQRRKNAHDTLNVLHVDLIATLCSIFHAGKDFLSQADKVVLRDELIRHLENVRLLLLRT